MKRLLLLSGVLVFCVSCTVSKSKIVVKNSNEKKVVVKKDNLYEEEYTKSVAVYNDTVQPKIYQNIDKNIPLIKQ